MEGEDVTALHRQFINEAFGQGRAARTVIAATSNDLDAKSPFVRLGGAGTVDIGQSTMDYLAKATVVGTPAGQDALLAETARMSEPELLKTFNCGIGMIAVVAQDQAQALTSLLSGLGETVVQLGKVTPGQGVSYRGQSFNLGHDLVERLRTNNHFGYRESASEDEARQGVRRGQLAFALIIPADFSANAVPGLQAGRGRLVVHTSAGNNYESSVLAAQFAKALGEDVNRTLNERRWSLVLSASAGSQQNVERLHQGLAQLRAGAGELAQGAAKAESSSAAVRQGAQRLQDGVARLADGTHQLGTGLRAMEAGLPPVEDVRSLRLGAEALAAGHQELAKGLQELRQGSQRLALSVEAFKAEADHSLFVPSSVSDGLARLRQGVDQLDLGLAQAQTGQQQLSQGAAQLSTQTGALARGVRDLRAGLLPGAARRRVRRLPARADDAYGVHVTLREEIRGQGTRDGISGWVAPWAFTSADPEFVANLKLLYQRQIQVQALIAAKTAAVGMTLDEVALAKGKPTKTSVRKTGTGQSGRWEFIDYEEIKHYTTTIDPQTGQAFRQLAYVTQEEKSKTAVEFENDVVTAVEESEDHKGGNVRIIVPPLIFRW